MDILTRVVVSEGGIRGLSSKVDGSILLVCDRCDDCVWTAVWAGAGVAGDADHGLGNAEEPGFDVIGRAISREISEIPGCRSSSLYAPFVDRGNAFYPNAVELEEAEFGNQHGEVITFSIAPQLNGYNTLKTVRLVDQLRNASRRLPGVRGVGSSEIALLTGTDMGGNITVEGEKI